MEHRAFAVETYFKNNNSVVVTQRIFRQHFNIHWNDSVPSGNAVLMWMRSFRQTGSAVKRKSPGREPLLRTPENIEGVRQTIVKVLGLQECADKGRHLTDTIFRK